MITGRRSTDWLAATPQADDASGARRRQDRRQGDRRAPQRRIDTLFAATLINQLSPDRQTLAACPYAKAQQPRPGEILDFDA